ncbi:MAG: LD-carboxypeptidase [Methanomassiliicoccales archaeon]|nr:LD-carboxypeptidase [Methanomassiliicoccales archaeon]
MSLPRKLPSGGTLGLVPPSSSAGLLSPRVWRIGADRLQGKGFRLKVADHASGRHGHASGTIEERVEDLMDMFADPEVDAIMCIIGGFNCHQLLEHLDYDLIYQAGKPFVGFSDITALNNAIWSRCGLLNFSGPCFITFCQPELPRYTEECFERVLMGEEEVQVRPSVMWAEDRWYDHPDLGPREWKTNPGWRVLNPGRARGTALGGNLSTFMLLAGTEYWPDLEGALLFLEEDGDETPQTIDRHLTHLRHLGAFESISGLVLGRFPSQVGFSAQDGLEAMVQEAIKGYDLPVLADVDISHTDPLFTIPIGGRAEMDTDEGLLRFRGPFVR